MRQARLLYLKASNHKDMIGYPSQTTQIERKELGKDVLGKDNITGILHGSSFIKFNSL